MTKLPPMSETDIDTLETKVLRWREAYYNGVPEVPDSVYDPEEDRLRHYRPGSKAFKTIGATAPVNGAWPKVRHTISMVSLNKAQTEPEMGDWVRSTGAGDFVIMDKLDGCSLSVRMDKRHFSQALSRGDGLTGEDVTRNVRLVQGMVKTLTPSLNGVPTPDVVYIRGEIICKKSDFKAHFHGESNPRSTANGTLKRQTGHEKCAHLTFIAYELMPNGQPMASKELELRTLSAMGFETPLWSKAGTSAEVTKVYAEYIKAKRASLDYEIDGLVLSVNDSRARETLGELNHKPRGAVAYKFPHEEKPTILRDIEWQVGNSGRITPVAIFDEVILGGKKVTRASLAGVQQVEHMRLYLGCRVLTSMRNDVIPRIEANLDLDILNDL